MILDDVINLSLYRLKSIDFKNDLSLDQRVNLSLVNDTIEISDEGILPQVDVLYRRKMIDDNNALSLTVEYLVKFELMGGYEKNSSVQELIKDNKEDLFMFAATEASLLVANILKSVSSNAVITPPVFYSGHDQGS